MYALIKKLPVVLASQVFLLGFCLVCLAQPSFVSAANSIPAGCPGSKQAGPAKPGSCTSVTVQYCKAHLKGKAQAACTTKNMDTLRDSVADECTANDKELCIEKAAEKIIDQVARQNPKTVADFNKTLNKAIKDAKTVSQGGQPPHCSGTNCDLIALYVNPFIKLLSICVGLAVAASLILGGIQYSASGGDPQKTSAAKSRIQNTLLAFLAFAFLYAFLNFLIPGGLFN